MNQKENKRFNLWKNSRGSAAMMVAITLPALIGFGALAVDVGHFYTLRTNMQQATDLGALAILTRMRDTGQIDQVNVGQAAASYGKQTVDLANANMPARAKNEAVQQGDITFGRWDFNKKVFLTDPTERPANAVRIEAHMSEQRNNPIRTMFGKIFKDHVDASVSTLAVLPVPNSFLVLSENADGALTMKNHADIDTNTIHVNSTSDKAFQPPTYAHQTGVYSVHVAGGIAAGSGSPVFKAEADKAADFLEGLPPIDYSKLPCVETNLELDGGGTHVLRPGRYCGGLTIRDVDEVTFETGGTFIIEGGPFVVDNLMEDRPIMGDGVLIYLADEAADAIVAGADFSLQSRRAGPYAGVVFMVAPGLSPAPEIVLDRAEVYFGGIFYAPKSAVTVRGGSIDGICGYVCFVTDTLELDGSRLNVTPDLVGNVDPWGNVSIPPAAPPALLRNFRPTILSRSSQNGQ